MLNKFLKFIILFIFPISLFAQYPNSGNKLRLGFQTTADGLVWRGVLADTGIISPISNTSAYIILDTVNNRFFNYKRNTNVWSIAGGSDTSLIAYVNTYGTQTVRGEKTFVENLKLSGTGNKTFIIESIGSGFPLIQIKGSNPVSWNLENGRSTANLFGIYQSGGTGAGTIWFSIAEGGAASFANTLSVSAAATFLSTVSTQALTATSLTASGAGNSTVKATSTGAFPLFQLVDSRSGGSTWNIEGGRTLANLQIRHSTGQIAELTPSAQFGIGVAGPTAVLHLKAGTATASTSPLKFTTGPLLDVPEMGAMEFSTGKLYFSPTSGVGNREEIAYAKNFVDLTTTQTVAGEKTLTSNLILKNSQEPSRSTFLASQTFSPSDTIDWTRGTGWTFNGTLAVATAATGDLTYTTLPDTIISGRAYEITYTQSGYSSGTATIALGNATLAIPQYNVTGNIIIRSPTLATGGFRITTSTYTGNLDNISIVEITGTAPVIFSGQDDGSVTLYNSLRMPNSTTLAFGGGGARTTGANNNFFGTNSGQNNTTGLRNNFFGVQSGQNNTTGINNNFFGTSAGENNTTGSQNNFFGTTAGQNNITGSSNNFFGNSAGINNTTGVQNNFFGFQAGRNNKTGANNNFFGTNAGDNNTTGSSNVAIGTSALYNTTTGDTLTGSNNIAIGTNAGDNIRFAAAGNVAIGNSIDLPDAGGSNQVVIKNIIFATGASGTGTTIAGNVGIGTNAPTSRLVVKGIDGTSTNSALNVTNSSDASLLSVRNDGLVTIGTPLPVASGGTGSATQNFVDLTTNQSTIAGEKTFTGKLTSSNFQFNGVIRDNLNNSVITQSANNVSTNRTFTFGNATYANYHVKFKQFIFNTADTLPSTTYLFYVNGTGLGGGTDGSDIYFKGMTPTSGSTRAGSDFIIDLPDGFAGGRRGNVGIGILNPTSALHLLAGTSAASTAPLKFTSGTNLTTAEAGAMEFNGTNLFFSPSTTRHTVNHGLTGSATLDFPSTLTMLSADLTITVTGAADGDVVSLGVPNAAVNANTFYSAWVSSANTVTVRFNNYSVGTVNPSSALFKVFVTK